MIILTLKNGEITKPGGINKAILELNKELTKRGHECIVITTNDSNLHKDEIYQGFRIVRINKGFNWLYGLNLNVYKYLKTNLMKLKPDIIHVHGFHGLFSLEVITLIKRFDNSIPIIFTPHYDPLNRSTIAGKLLGNFYVNVFGKKILNLVDHVISISNFEAKNIRKISGPAITIVPHGVDNINIKNKIKDDLIKLLYVGYLLDYKGVQYIIESLNRLVYVENIQKIKLTIIGEGEFKETLIQLSKKLGVYEKINWYPFLPHKKILEEMENHDIFLLLSKTEGYGIVVAESLSRGTPTIVTKRTALEEFTTEEGCFGVECPPKPYEVADLIVKIYKNNVKVGPFTDKIRTWDLVAKDYEKVYLNITERS